MGGRRGGGKGKTVERTAPAKGSTWRVLTLLQVLTSFCAVAEEPVRKSVQWGKGLFPLIVQLPAPWRSRVTATARSRELNAQPSRVCVCSACFLPRTVLGPCLESGPHSGQGLSTLTPAACLSCLVTSPEVRTQLADAAGSVCYRVWADWS